MLRKIVISAWLLVISALFLYSFTQVDLGLTFSRASFFQTVEKSFQYVGYFNRPISTLLYSSIVLLLFTLYCWTLTLVWKKKLQRKAIWVTILLASVILLFSYNAFSYDLFNYIFDAKIVTHYHQNPYFHKALDYPQDPMLGFMHWTHRTYPYGPLWLGLTIPLSFLGGGYFILTFYLFKAFMVGSYIISCFFIEKIARKTKIIDPLFALAFFALHPFTLIESLVSAHIDIVMMAAILIGVYLILVQKKFSGLLFLLISAGIKFATIILLPLFLWYPFSKQKNKDFFFTLCSVILMLFGVYLASSRTTFQPWYFLLVFPFAALLTHKYYIFIPTILFSFFILFQYAPFLYTGNFDPPIPMIMNQMLWWSIGISVCVAIGWGVFKRLGKSK